MPVFVDRFHVNAPVEAVSIFHSGTRALRRLTPPPVIVQFHHVEPLAEGSRSEFTLWFGPLPIRWLAVHSACDPASGFIDTQERGPMASWRHRHAWQALPDGTTAMSEEVTYAHHPGTAGLLTRILFAPPMLALMFAYRRAAIRHGCET